VELKDLSALRRYWNDTSRQTKSEDRAIRKMMREWASYEAWSKALASDPVGKLVAAHFEEDARGRFEEEWARITGGLK